MFRPRKGRIRKVNIPFLSRLSLQSCGQSDQLAQKERSVDAQSRELASGAPRRPEIILKLNGDEFAIGDKTGAA